MIHNAFRRTVTFNVSDSSLVRTKDGRIAVLLGVEERCDVIVRALHRTGIAMGPSDIKRHLGPKWPYSHVDIQFAMYKLVRLGVIEQPKGFEIFRLTPNGKKLWDSRNKKARK